MANILSKEEIQALLGGQAEPNQAPDAPGDAQAVGTSPEREALVQLGRIALSEAAEAALRDGAVIDLDQGIGELLEIRIGQRLVALGQLVVMDDRLGIRIVQTAAPDSGTQD